MKPDIDQAESNIRLTRKAVFELLLESLWDTNRLTADELDKWTRLFQGAV